VPADDAPLAAALRQADLDELEAQGLDSLEAITVSREAGVALTVDVGGPIAMFGCRHVVTSPHVFGAVWLLGTDAFPRYPRFILEEGPTWLQRIAKGCHYTGNVVDCRNEVSIRWLKHLGYRFLRQREIGGIPFWEFLKSHV
jgi:hypothetical protein